MKPGLGETLRALPGPILVTGHTGFKGTWMTILLEKLNVSVVGISLPPEPDSLYSMTERRNKIKEEFIDIRNLIEFRSAVKKFQPSAVLHMAAQPLVLESYESPLSTFEINVMGTANLLQICQETASVESVGVVTTDKVYRNHGLKRAFSENDALEGKDPYSASKVAAESVVSGWREVINYQGGAQIFALRAGNVIGGGDRAKDRLLPDIVRSKLFGTDIKIRNPKSTRPWQHVLDPLYGYVLALENSIRSIAAPAYNFGPNSKSLTVEKVIQIANDQWQRSTLMGDLGNSPSVKYEAVSLAIDASLAIRELGWRPHLSQEDAVISTIKWWKVVAEGKVSEIQACMQDIEYFLANQNT
jgi:CDP-glucose 4,6-dehydratase